MFSPAHILLVPRLRSSISLKLSAKATERKLNGYVRLFDDRNSKLFLTYPSLASPGLAAKSIFGIVANCSSAFPRCILEAEKAEASFSHNFMWRTFGLSTRFPIRSSLTNLQHIPSTAQKVRGSVYWLINGRIFNQSSCNT